MCKDIDIVYNSPPCIGECFAGIRSWNYLYTPSVVEVGEGVDWVIDYLKIPINTIINYLKTINGF